LALFDQNTDSPWNDFALDDISFSEAGGGPAPVAAGGDEYTYNGDTYGWYDDGWNGGGWYIIGCEFRRGFCFGGREGWHGWEHRGSHSHARDEHSVGEHRQIPIPGSRARGSYAVPTVHVPTVHVNVRRSGYVGGGARRGGGGGGGGHGRRSDIRLKHDIVLVGHLVNGLGYYRFSYNGSDKAYVGVMAQEVQAVMPEAVVRGSDGYLRVYYNRLGIRMQTWNERVASGQGIPPTAAIRH